MKTKNERKKKQLNMVTLLLLLALIVVVGLLGVYIFILQYDKNNIVEETQDYRKYGKYYAMITSDDRADFWQSVYSGAKDEGEANDAYVELFAGNLGNSYDMTERLEIAIASDVDGLIIEGEDNIVLQRTLDKAIESGIPVVMVSQDFSEIDRISFVGISRYDLGRTYGKETVALASQMLKDGESLNGRNDKLSVMILMDQESDSTGQNIMLSAVKEEISKESSLSNKVVVDTYAVDDSGAFTAEESIRDIFMGQDDVPDILICLSEIHTNCAYQAVIDYNRVGRTNIIGYYDSSAILNAVQKEIVYSTISMDTAQMGRYCVDALSDYLDEGYVSDYYAVDTYVVGKDNVNEYLKGEE